MNAAQGIEFRRPLKTSPVLEQVLHDYRKEVPFIGDDVVIGAGSVVVKDIPSHSVAVGNPCHVIRRITDADREYWEGKAAEYRAWKDSLKS